MFSVNVATCAFLEPANRRRSWADKSSLPTSFAAFLNTSLLKTRSLRWQPPRAGVNSRASGLLETYCAQMRFHVFANVRGNRHDALFTVLRGAGHARAVLPVRDATAIVTTAQSRSKSFRRNSDTSPNRIPHQPASNTSALNRRSSRRCPACRQCRAVQLWSVILTTFFGFGLDAPTIWHGLRSSRPSRTAVLQIMFRMP